MGGRGRAHRSTPTWEPIRIPALCYLEAHLKLSSAGQERTVAKRASFGICGARAGGGDGGSCLSGTASTGERGDLTTIMATFCARST